MQRREAIADTQKTMPAAATRPTGKRSRRGRLSEGAPTKRTSEVIQKIADAIALGLADDEAASLAGISDMTLTKWRRDPEFVGKIKNAVRNILSCAAKLFLFNGCVTVPEGSHASLSTSRAFDAGFDSVWNTRRSLVAASVIHKDFDGLTS